MTATQTSTTRPTPRPPAPSVTVESIEGWVRDAYEVHPENYDRAVNAVMARIMSQPVRLRNLMLNAEARRGVRAALHDRAAVVNAQRVNGQDGAVQTGGAAPETRRPQNPPRPFASTGVGTGPTPVLQRVYSLSSGVRKTLGKMNRADLAYLIAQGKDQMGGIGKKVSLNEYLHSRIRGAGLVEDVVTEEQAARRERQIDEQD